MKTAIFHRTDRRGALRLAMIAMMLTSAAGCFKEPLRFTEVKRVDEKVTEREFKRLLRVAEALPDQRLPDFPPVFAPPPEWQESRTLSVSDLVAEEQGLLEERTSVEWLAKQLHRKRSLQRALRREEMTPEQFVGLTLAVGMGLCRTTLRENRDLDKILKMGEAEMESLRTDDRPFSELTLEEMHSVLKRAMWITRLDRAKRIKQVPPENIALVERHRASLEAILPRELTGNPLDAVADLLEEQGLPFEDLPESDTDAHIQWSPEQAIRGTDSPDPEFESQPQWSRPLAPFRRSTS